VATGSETIRVVRAVDDLDVIAPALSARVAVVGDLHVDQAWRAPAAARLLSAGDVVIVQHEFGIYGGADGEDVVLVLEALTSPSIVVLHTVLDSPTPHQRRVLERVAAAATAVVVMTEAARTILAASYRVDMGAVSVIPHGVPDWVPTPTTAHDDRRTMLTWGLIGPGKGIEWGIRAVAALGATTPPLHYEILGETHPKVVAHEGEAYRESLELLARDLGVADRVTFDSRYLDSDALAARVAEADLVLLPYDSRIQVTSGVLVEAVAAGRPVIATGFPHARELIDASTGIIVDHRSPTAIADAIREVLSRPSRAPSPRPETGTPWGEVAEQYRVLAEALVASTLVRTA
jgi:glycosyltransferase involved in cell wall biosynthesis